MEYAFDIDCAEKYGVNEAIMIKNFQFWILKNKSNNINFHEGRWWTYNSNTAFKELYKFWTEKQIRTILTSLLDQQIIIKGNFNKMGYDRTLWYAFFDESIFLKGQIDLPKKANGIAQTGEPIPDIKPYKENFVSPSGQNKESKKDKKNKEYSPELRELIKLFYINYKAVHKKEIHFDKKEIGCCVNLLKSHDLKEIVKRLIVLRKLSGDPKNTFYWVLPSIMSHSWNKLIEKESIEKSPYKNFSELNK